MEMTRLKVNRLFYFEGRFFRACGEIVWVGHTRIWKTFREPHGRKYFEVKFTGYVYLGWTFSSGEWGWDGWVFGVGGCLVGCRKNLHTGFVVELSNETIWIP